MLTGIETTISVQELIFSAVITSDLIVFVPAAVVALFRKFGWTLPTAVLRSIICFV